MTSSRFNAKLLALLIALIIVSAPLLASDYKPEIDNALNKKDTAQAILLLEQEIKNDPAYAPNYLLLGQIAYARNKLDNALKYFNTALDKKSKLYEALYYVGKVYLDKGDLKEAEKAFEKGMKRAKEEKSLFHNGMGLLLLKKEEFAKADIEFRKAIQEGPDRAEFHANLGDANYYSKIYALAINEYNEVIKMDTTFLDVYFRLSRCYVAMGQFNKALEQLTVVLSRDSMYANAWKEAGKLYTLAGLSARDPETKKQRFTETIGSYRKYLQLANDSSDGEVFFNLGRAYFNLSAFTEAKEALSYVLSLGDTPSNIFLYLGRAEIGLEQYQAGIDNLKKHLDELNANDPGRTLGPEDADLYRRIADAYRAIEDHTDAAEFYVKSLEIDPNNDRVATLAALSFHQLKEFTPALEYYDKRIALGNVPSSIYMNAALCALNLEENERAIGYLEKVVELEPNDSKAYGLLSSTYMNAMGDCKNGLKWTQKLYDMDSTNCDALQTLGYAYFSTDGGCQADYLKAISYFKRALDCYQQKGQDNCGNSAIMLRIAQAYHLQAAGLVEANKKAESKVQFKNAYDWYKKALKCNPADADAKKGVTDTEFEF